MKPSKRLDKWRYVIVLAKFMVHFLHPGLVKSLSVLIPYLVIQLDMECATAGILVALESGIHLMACPISHYLAKRFGCRLVATIGGFLSAISLMVGTFSQTVVLLGCSLFFTGFFASPLRQVSSEMLHQHFREHFGLATTITQLGSQLGGFLMPYLTVLCLEAYGLRGSLLLLSAMLLHWVPIGAAMRSPRCLQGQFEKYDSERRDDAAGSLEPLQTSHHDGRTQHQHDQNIEGIVAKREDFQYNSWTEPKNNRNLQETLSNMIRNMILETLDLASKERVFIFMLLPCQVLFDICYCGWVVFLFSYGIAEGLPKDKAVYMMMMGSLGGVIGRLLLVVVLYKHPLVTPHLLAINLWISSIALLVYPIYSSPTYLALCSFVAGCGFYNSYSTVYGAISVIVRKENFPKAIACSLMLTGISYLISGILTGSLYDRLDSYKVIFRILGILLAATSLTISIYVCVDSSQKNRRSL